MEIQLAKDSQARSIARLIMQAMNYDCCRYFAGPDHTLDDFERMMTSLVQSEKSQYSYLNAIVAVDEDGGEPCGVCISYDGARLHELRERMLAGEALSDGDAVLTYTTQTEPISGFTLPPVSLYITLPNSRPPTVSTALSPPLARKVGNSHTPSPGGGRQGKGDEPACRRPACRQGQPQGRTAI